MEHAEVGTVEQRWFTLAHRDDDGDRIGDQAPRREQERLGAGRVEQVCVVDGQEKRPIVGVRRQQAQRSSPGREPVPRGGGRKRKGTLERRRLRGRDAVDRAERRPQQFGEAGEWHLRLGLDAARTENTHRCRAGDRVLEQRGLADPRLPHQREHATPPAPRLREQPVDGQPLLFAAQQHAPILATRLP